MIKPFWEYEQNKNSDLDIPVGETFDYKGMTLKVVPDNGSYCCNDCFFAPKKEKDSCFGFACFADERLDGQDVILEEVKNDKKEG